MEMAKCLFILNFLIVALVSGNPFAYHVDPSSRIVGGFQTTIEKHPWQVSLQYYSSHICGGSIIGNKWLLTAGHCIWGSDAEHYSARVGSSFFDEEDGSIVQVNRIIRHKNYNLSTVDFDFSLLELSEELTLSDKVQPIALPDENIAIEDGEDALISGWGDTENSNESDEQLRAAHVPIVNQQYCDEVYNGTITDRMICAGFEQGGKDSCQGDSGGPISIENGGVRVLVGVVSWGYGCAKPKYPGVYGRVTSVRSWIRSETGI